MSESKKYIVIGSGKLTVQIAEYLKSKNLSPVVYEKQIAEASSVRRMCEKKKIPYESMDSAKMTERLMKDLSEHRIFVFSAINTYIFPKKVIEHENFKGINYHNALLPYHRGMNAEAWAIYYMDSVTGITWHRIRPAIDEGEILIQKKITLDENMTSLKLLKKQSDLAYEAFLEIIPQLLSDDKISSINQKNIENSVMHRKRRSEPWIFKYQVEFQKNVCFSPCYGLRHTEYAHKTAYSPSFVRLQMGQIQN